jgi:Fic-DOC domain mobile mystery protein B
VAGWGAVEGESPIDPSGLRNRGAIRNRRELAAAEARGIHRAMVKYLAARPSRRSAPFTFEWFLKLHREMFGEVWTWAGILRTHDLNLGVTHALIREQLAALVADLHSWTGFGHALEDQAVWLHHRAVSIHPFENGNGRWSRLLANIWLRRHERPIILWPDRLLGPTSAVRGDYIDAMRAGDHGNFGPLGRFHDRFRETKD